VALPADQFEDSLAAARANLATADGKAYAQRIEARFAEKHRADLARCAESAGPEELAPFTVLMEVGGGGTASRILLRPPTKTAICLRWALREDGFPKPPTAGYWAMLDLDPKEVRGLAVSEPKPTAAPAPSPAPAPATPEAAPRAPAPRPAVTPAPPAAPDPVIDMHLHAMADGPALAKAGLNEKTHREATLEAMKRNNVVKAFVSGFDGTRSAEVLERWRQAAPDRMVASVGFHLDDDRPAPAALRRAYRAGQVGGIGEIFAQYDGLGPDAEALEGYWTLAEELDAPVAIHLGPESGGGGAKYRVALGNPLLLEEVLLRHPGLRLDVMHAGWPMLDAMLAILSAYPGVHVDTGGIAWRLPRAEFHAYLRRLVEAGFGSRILFGSDALEDPGRIGASIEAIRSVDFLTAAQKRDILYANAARFLRLAPK
jgi:predicted TIM-barrel fold metal-dependent hydrolase